MSFKGVLFDPASGGSKKVAARVVLGALEISPAAGEPTVLRVDLARVTLAAGGWDRGSVQLVWSGEAGAHALTTDDPAAAEELAKAPGLQGAVAQAGREQARVRRQGRFGLALLAALTILPVALLLLIWAFRGSIVDALLERLPTTFDVEVAKMFEGDIVASSDTLKGTAANEAVEAIVRRLQAAAPDSPFEFRVHVQKNAQVNAFAAPGGLIVVYTGLIREASSPDEVAGVLAHEMAHVTRRHSMRQMLYRAGVLPLMGLLVGSPEAASIFETAGQLSDLGFSREQESDADSVGYEILRRARLPAGGMASFFDQLSKIGGAAPPALLSTHPDSAERAAALRERIARDGKAVTEPLDVDWEAARAASARAGSPAGSR